MSQPLSMSLGKRGLESDRREYNVDDYPQQVPEVEEEATRTIPVRDALVLVMMTIGFALACVGAFMLWGPAATLFVAGIVVTLYGLVIGLL